ncbi:MAG: hypothetical protein ABFC77_01020 [Thermoguttaceae bacterium]
MRKTLALTIAAFLGLVATVRAEPLDMNRVSADAKWAVHLDVDALHASSLFQKTRQKVLEKHPEAAAGLAMVREVWKFDPCTDLHGITVYSSQLKKDTGVAIVHAKVNQPFLLERLKQASEHRVSTYGKYEVHSWLHAKGCRRERYMAGAFFKPDVLVFGGSSEEVMAALDVLGGVKPSYAGKGLPSGGKIHPGAILVVSAIGLGDLELPCKSPLSKQVESLVLATGESDGKIFVEGTLAAKKPETAQQLKAVGDGALALATLLHGEDTALLKLISALKLTATEKTVSLEGSASVDDVWNRLQELVEKKFWRGPHRFGHSASIAPKEKK